MSLFETVSYLIIESIVLFPDKPILTKNRYDLLVTNDVFIKSLTYTIDSKISVNKRFEFIEKVIEEIRNA